MIKINKEMLWKSNEPIKREEWKCMFSSNGVRFKGVNLAPKGEGVSVADEWDVVPRAQRGFEVFPDALALV